MPSLPKKAAPCASAREPTLPFTKTSMPSFVTAGSKQWLRFKARSFSFSSFFFLISSILAGLTVIIPCCEFKIISLPCGISKTSSPAPMTEARPIFLNIMDTCEVGEPKAIITPVTFLVSILSSKESKSSATTTVLGAKSGISVLTPVRAERTRFSISAKSAPRSLSKVLPVEFKTSILFCIADLKAKPALLPRPINSFAVFSRKGSSSMPRCAFKISHLFFCCSQAAASFCKVSFTLSIAFWSFDNSSSGFAAFSCTSMALRCIT